MADIIKFDITSDDLLRLADKALADNDLVKHVEYLKKALANDPTLTEASIKLAQVYAALGLFEISNNVVFEALDKGVDEEARFSLYAQLAMNFADMGSPEVAEYYIRDYSDDFDISFPEEQREKLKLVRPHSAEDDGEAIIAEASRLVDEQRFDDAIALLDGLSPDAKCKEEADHLVLLCLMVKDDIDAVIDNAKRMLERDGDSLVVKSTLVTAYFMEGKSEEARQVIDDILSHDYDDPKDIMLILPLLINLELNEEIAKYAGRMLEKDAWHPNAMVWLAIALYNLGRKAEANKIIRKVDAIFGEYSPAAYYIQLFATDPDHVEYSMDMPHGECMEYLQKLQMLMIASPTDVKRILDSDDGELGALSRRALEWAFKNGDSRISGPLTHRLSMSGSEWLLSFFRRKLLTGGLSYELVVYMVGAIIDEPLPEVRFNVVAQDRFKEISFIKPAWYSSAPEPLKSSFKLCVADIIYTDEEPDRYIARLLDIFDDLLRFDAEKEPAKAKRLHKISKLRSYDTVAGVLLGKVYEEDETREETIERYGLTARTYDKYFKIFFGDDDGGED